MWEKGKCGEREQARERRERDLRGGTWIKEREGEGGREGGDVERLGRIKER